MPLAEAIVGTFQNMCVCMYVWVQETWFQSQSQEVPLEEEIANQSSILVGKKLMNRGAWQARVDGITKSDMIERLNMPVYIRQISVQSSSLSHVSLCDPMDCSTPGFFFYHQLLEPTQTHIHHVGDDIQPSHPVLSPFPPAFNFSQHQGLFKWVSSSHQVAKVLELQFQHQSFQWIFRTDFL